MPHLTFHTTSEDQTDTLGQSLALLLRPGDILGLDGPLGAGKTALVRGIAAGLNLDPAQVSSPTYVLVHEYTSPAPPGSGTNVQTPPSSHSPLFHLDAYRLAGPEDLDSLGWDRILDAFGIIVIEWAERIAPALAQEPSLARLRIQPEGATVRRIDLIVPPSWAARPQWRHIRALAAAGEAPHTGLPEGWARCPVTDRPVAPNSPTFPFADDRARLADLGRWLTGAYTLSRELREEDADDPDLA